MGSRSAWCAAAGSLMILAGCASTLESTSSPMGPPRATSSAAGPTTSMGAGSASDPSPTARLVCGSEIRGDISKVVAEPKLPSGRASWTSPTYTCTYRVGGTPVVLTVEDSPDARSGRAFFDSLRRTLGPTQQIHGLPAFGLPSYETSDGTVVFLKDGKTLRVDATRLGTAAIPGGQSRTDIAYAVAADVIGCWSE